MRTIFQVWRLKNTELLTSGDRTLVAEIPGTKREIQRWVRFGGVIPTHMGELRKHGDGYLYYTTIGQTYQFARVRI